MSLRPPKRRVSDPAESVIVPFRTVAALNPVLINLANQLNPNELNDPETSALIRWSQRPY